MGETAQTTTEADVNPDDFYPAEGEGDKSEDKTEDVKPDESDDKSNDKSEDKKADDEDKSDDKGEEDVVPEKYEFNEPEGTLLDQDDVDRIASRAKELGLSQEEAQDLYDIESNAVKGYHEKLLKEMGDARKDWIEAAENDKEIGGENFKENLEHSKRVIEKFGSDEFKKFLNETGFGDNVEVIRVFSRISKLMADDKFIPSNKRGGGEKPMEDIFYPDDK